MSRPDASGHEKRGSKASSLAFLAYVIRMMVLDRMPGQGRA